MEMGISSLPSKLYFMWLGYVTQVRKSCMCVWLNYALTLYTHTDGRRERLINDPTSLNSRWIIFPKSWIASDYVKTQRVIQRVEQIKPAHSPLLADTELCCCCCEAANPKKSAEMWVRVIGEVSGVWPQSSKRCNAFYSGKHKLGPKLIFMTWLICNRGHWYVFFSEPILILIIRNQEEREAIYGTDKHLQRKKILVSCQYFE